MKNHYTCYCVDSRGHGLSSSVAVYSYQSMAEDIIEFIKSLLWRLPIMVLVMGNRRIISSEPK
ncbi:MAG: alpha/beta fold hydrolase [Thomasclavelia ramosa]